MILPQLNEGRAVMLTGSVTVYNIDGETVLHTVSVAHAIRMVIREVAVVIEETEEVIGNFFRPVAVRLIRYQKMQWRYQRQPKWSKNGVLKRDNFTCAFCAGKATTIDHVKPKAQGGGNSWKNTIAACSPCNNKKANRTPEQARMPLLFKPKVPDWSDVYKRKN
jgi:5-methylcytosine-specific restriction endonuclease McrA